MTMYRDYYIRALPKDWPTLIGLGVKLGALSVHKTEDGESVVSATTPGSWDFIGVLYKPTGMLLPASDEGGEAVPEMTEVTDEKGTAYWHANLRTTVHLGEVARTLGIHPSQVLGMRRRGDLPSHIQAITVLPATPSTPSTP
jgi:hypothetical protein